MNNEKIIEQIKTRFETMTNKEQTIKRIEAQKEKIEEHKKEYGRVSLFDKLELKYLENVLKDLEVLEALKRNVGIRLAIQEWANKESKVFPNDRKIVKEWLDNDR